MASCDQLHVKIHNFGIYKKNGKRAILQLDFPGESIYLIQRGHIKKTYNFEQLQHFDSEEGLHIVLKFKDSEFEFDADNVEEKYTLCRLISLVLDKDEEEDGATTPGIKDSGRRVSVLPTLPMLADKVIKEAVLEKKGNTTITTWNKRRLRVTPGEFSYYKPGTELALNIVQVWEDICSVRRSGQHGFNVTVRNRVYSFRLLHDQRANNPEVEREEWIEAFQKAMKSKRHTLVMLEKTSSLDTPRSNLTAFEFPSQPAEEEPVSIDELIKRRKQSTEENNNEPLEQVTLRKPEVTKHFSVHLSYVEKTTPLDHLPTSSRPKPPAFVRQDATARADLSKVSGGSSSETEVSVDNGSSGTDDVASVRAKWNIMDKKSSENSSDKADVASGSHNTGNVNRSKREQSTMEVKIDFTEPEPDYPPDDKPSPPEAKTSKSLPGPPPSSPNAPQLPPPPTIPAPIPTPRTLTSSNNQPTSPNTNNTHPTSPNANTTALSDTAGVYNNTDLPPTPTSPAPSPTKRAPAGSDDKYKDRPLPSPTTPPPPIPAHIPAPLPEEQ
ncbi:proteoglycan 4-like isoform X2 [Haliotis rubra]|nr:proteoglycan 4-like isoform X2 [Haliotis rubra]